MRLTRDLQTWLTIFCGISLILAMGGIHVGFSFAAVAFGSYFALAAAGRSIKRRSLDVNFLMVFAAAGSVILGHALEAAVLLFLFSLSSTLESFAMARTRNAIEGLIKLRPDSAMLVAEAGDKLIPVEELKIGDHIRVLPFENIPADAKIVSGSTTIDQSAMTGESAPAQKHVGDSILAGTQNLESMIVAQVTAEVGNTLLEKIVELVRDAQDNKASGERISEWFGQKYTYFVLFSFGVMFVVRLYLRQPLEQSAYGALTILVALSPCAVVISTPASTLSALAWAARNGILVRGGAYIELAGKIDTLAVDKTGTLTVGKPQLTEICVCTGAMEPVGASRSICVDEHACWSHGEEMSAESQTMLRYAAAAEQYSSHPIADAIVSCAREAGIDVPEAVDSTTVPGLGVTATIDGKHVRIGQRRFFESNGAILDQEFAVHAEELQRKGMTVAILEVEGRMAALGLTDSPRDEAPDFLQTMRRLGANRQIMITGDTTETAEAIAKQLSIREFRAGLMPDEKTALIRELIESGHSVMMVGDGINDAPSMATATVGVAMGGLGSDIALNSADVVLMQDRLDKIPELVRLGRRTNRIIRANLYFASGVITFLAIGSLLGDHYLPQFRNWILPFAVVGHEGSTVLVILNGLRLLWGPGR
jgi:Cd2+/Zn2+-exporting ATPase